MSAPLNTIIELLIKLCRVHVAIVFLAYCGIAQAVWSTDDIRAMQERLTENSFYAGPVTGILDSATQSAIERATAAFPEIKTLPASRKEYFIGQILSWYNNAYELKRAESPSAARDGSPKYLSIRSSTLPRGHFRRAVREGGGFKHIEHRYEFAVYSNNHLIFTEQFINHKNSAASAKASISGRYRIGRWGDRSADTLFFYVTGKSGDVWTARTFMKLARRAGRLNLPVSFSVTALGNNVIEINGDKFSRVSARY